MPTNVQITSRDLHTLVKRHVTTDELLSRYGLSSQEELFSLIREATPGEARMFIKELQKSDKKTISRKSKKSEVVQADETSFSTDVDKSASEEPVTSEASEATTFSVVSSFEPFSEMQKKESSMSDELIHMELAHEQIQKDRHKLIGNLKEIEIKLASLQEMIEKCQSSATKIVTEFNLKAEEMTQLSERIRDHKKELEALRQRIEESKKAIVWVYANGVIEIESPLKETPIVSDSEVDLVPFISEHMTVMQELNLKQIGALAKLDKLLQKLTDISLPYEVIFDDDNMQSVYSTAVTAE